MFFFGLSAVGVLLGLAWTFNHEYQYRLLRKSLENGLLPLSVRSLAFVSCVSGVSGAVGLPLFASFDTSPAVHDVAAVVFLVTEAIAMYLDVRAVALVTPLANTLGELTVSMWVCRRTSPIGSSR